MSAVIHEVLTLHGELTEWRHIRDGWGKGELRTSVERVDFVGTLTGVRVGDSVELTGAWDHHPRYGRQFKVRQAVVRRPESPEGIIKWLASTLPDVGDNRARKLVERFGVNLWAVIENDHKALTEVEGITPPRAEAIKLAYFEHKAERDNMIALRGWGLTDKQISRCIDEWGNLAEVVRRIRTNPFHLSRCVHGFGFLRADKVATKVGVAHDAPERIEAAVVHALEDASETHGHCYAGGGALVRIVSEELLQVPAAKVEQGIRDAETSGLIVVQFSQPDAEGKRSRRIYLTRLYVAERDSAGKLAQLLTVKAS